MKDAFRCWAEVDLNALRENLAWLRHRVGPAVKIMTVVKADAYGHGLKQIAALLMQSGSDLFGVANLYEARAIRSVGQGWPILMLGACLPHEVETAVRDDVMPTLSTIAEARRFAVAGRRAGKTVPVHVKVDTGMGRLGVAPDQALELIRRIRRSANLTLDGLYTHYAAAEDNPGFTRLQTRCFRHLLACLESEGIRIPHIHADNSAALLHEPDTVHNLIRPGLLVYGVAPPGRRPRLSALDRHLRPALSFHCRLSLIKEVPRGTPLSYGGTFVTSRRMRVGTVTAGYGDGYPRAASNRAEVLVHGRHCPVLGRVTMDQMLVELPRGLSAEVGDEVVLFGRQGDGEITVGQVAEWCGTVAWEILTNITYRVPRIYRGGQAA